MLEMFWNFFLQLFWWMMITLGYYGLFRGLWVVIQGHILDDNVKNRGDIEQSFAVSSIIMSFATFVLTKILL